MFYEHFSLEDKTSNVDRDLFSLIGKLCLRTKNNRKELSNLKNFENEQNKQRSAKMKKFVLILAWKQLLISHELQMKRAVNRC